MARQLLVPTLTMKPELTNNLIDNLTEVVGHIRSARDDVEIEKVLRAWADGIQTRINTEKLEAAGRLAGWLAHKINNPLGAISGNAQLLARRLERDIGDPDTLETYNRHLSGIRQQVERCAEITNDLLDFTKPMDVSLSNVDVAQVVREASDIASHGISKSEITINSCASDGLVIKTDAELLARALHEILVNAMAAGDGPIEIAIAREVSDAVILVTDSGTGIPDEVLPRVFEPFFTTKEKARGLGLTRTLAFIEQLGGTVEIAKNGPDGTTVSVRVPDRGQNK